MYPRAIDIHVFTDLKIHDVAANRFGSQVGLWFLCIFIKKVDVQQRLCYFSFNGWLSGA
jgi:hypothetical protein